MQGEHFYDSPEYSYRLDEYEKRLQIIDDIRQEIHNVIEGLRYERLFHQGIADRIEYIFLSVMMARLDRVSSSTLSMSQDGVPSSPLNLDDPTFRQEMEVMTHNHAYIFRTQHPDAIREAIADGESAGTDYLLDMLIPDTIRDKDGQNNYFFPWRKDLLQMIGHPTQERGGGWEEASFTTRLPNIEVVHAYPPGELTVPKRIIRLRARK